MKCYEGGGGGGRGYEHAPKVQSLEPDVEVAQHVNTS